MGRKKKSEKYNINLNIILTSDGFQQIIKTLEEAHPYKRGLLDHNASIDQRANYQSITQGYEEVLFRLRSMVSKAKELNIETTYGAEIKKD